MQHTTPSSVGIDSTVRVSMNAALRRLGVQHPLLEDPALLREAANGLLHGPSRHRLQRLWAYYRNPMQTRDTIDTSNADRPYRQAQEWGLPARITGVHSGEGLLDATLAEEVTRKEVVIENDIGWRVDMMVDFLFGRPIVINSAAQDPQRATQIETLLRHILARNGGLIFLQQIALLGAVYGSVDVLVKYTPQDADDPSLTACATQLLGESSHAPSNGRKSLHSQQLANQYDLHPKPKPSTDALPSVPVPVTDDGVPTLPTPGNDDETIAQHDPDQMLQRLARMVRFEIVEPARALPLLSVNDCRNAVAYATVYESDQRQKATKTSRFLHIWGRLRPDQKRSCVIELISPTHWQRYEDDRLVAEGENALQRLPLVHIQNTADPLCYEGPSDVEPLIACQDELNTRLCDRANRIALTSFKMYLGKGISDFTNIPIAPGQMWGTENPDAEVIEFGGSSDCPSEEAHINGVREAMDKISGTSPIAAGAIKGRIGRLTSAAALRVTMLALLSRTERKRITYGTAIAQMCELALAWLDRAGLFATTPAERAIHIHWSNPIPANEIERLDEAKARLSIGIPRNVVLRELGYADSDIASSDESSVSTKPSSQTTPSQTE